MIKEARKKFRRVSEADVIRALDFARIRRNEAEQAAAARLGDKLVDYTPDKKCPFGSVLRVGYTIEIFDPFLDDVRNWGGFVDFDRNVSLEFAKQFILGQTIDKLMKFYEYQNLTKKDVLELYKTLQFQSVDCIRKE